MDKVLAKIYSSLISRVHCYQSLFFQSAFNQCSVGKRLLCHARDLQQMDLPSPSGVCVSVTRVVGQRGGAACVAAPVRLCFCYSRIATSNPVNTVMDRCF